MLGMTCAMGLEASELLEESRSSDSNPAEAYQACTPALHSCRARVPSSNRCALSCLLSTSICRGNSSRESGIAIHNSH